MRPFLAPASAEPLDPGAAPTFSVIVPAYQVAEYIGEAIESALAQTLPPLEIVVCDDGSTDDLDRALAPFRERIVVIRKENGGLATARNAAAAHTSGEFVVLLDGDDSFLPQRLEALAELAVARPDLDVLATDAYLVHDGRIIRRYSDDPRFVANDQRRAILRSNFIFVGAAIRRELLLSTGGFDPSPRGCEDWDLWVRLILGGTRVGCVDAPLALYRVRESSLSTNQLAMLKGELVVLRRAATHPTLSAEERVIVERSIALKKTRLRALEAQAHIRSGGPGARRRALAVAVGAGAEPRTRLKASLAAAAPGVARRLLRRRERAAFIGAGGIRVSRAPARKDSNDG